jgi:hypothetical protein
MISIPLEPRNYKGNEIFRIDLQLDWNKNYEVCASSLHFDSRQGNFHGGAIGSLHLDCVDMTIINPDQVITRICKTTTGIQTREWYKLDKRDLKYISLKLTGVELQSLSVTLQLREIDGQISTLSS